MELIADRVRQEMGSLTAAERKVARRLLSADPTAGLGSTVALAARAGVSGPTVTRFAKKLGFTDYAEFQRAVRADISAQMASPVEILEAGVSAQLDGLARYGALMADSVRNTLSSLAEHEFEAACGLVADRRRAVATVGGLTTHVLARHLATQLQQVRPSVRFLGDSSADTTSSVIEAGPRDTFVIIDLRRYEQRTIELAQELHRRSAKIVLLTDTWGSPVSNVADCVLPALVEGGYGFDSLVPTLALVEALIDRTARLLGDSALDRIRSYNELSVVASPRWSRPTAETSGSPSHNASVGGRA